MAKALTGYKRRLKKEGDKINSFPEGWDEKKIRSVINHYEKQTEEEEVLEDEELFAGTKQTFIGVPHELVSKIRELIASYEEANNKLLDKVS
ncbi:MAG: hypothetical protein ABRQ37_19975 [Candidatus Eremiobacterota bacterium]